MPTATTAVRDEVSFRTNMPEYFARRFGTNPIQPASERQVLRPMPKDFDGDRLRFARETILWGRKSGTMLVECSWASVDRPWVTSESAPQPGGKPAVELPRAANLGD